MNDFIWSLPIEKCGDTELDWTIKNLSANFQKLYGCTINLLQVQNFDFNDKSDSNVDLATLCTNLIEYFFLKINTIWELCYQIYLKLCDPKKTSKRSKHEYLEIEFDNYRRSTGREITLDWYEPINAVRNRIAHGGFSIKSFLSDDFLLFQVYNRDLDEQIVDKLGYVVHDKPLVYVDLYTTFYTTKTHQYIQEFLAFVINRMGNVGSTDEGLDILDRELRNSGKALYYGYEEIFISTAQQLGKRGFRSRAC
ncbi:hypothetical protein [Caballeronia novacaledonica]|uniref:hypothetical protein n=1 Tax=Caballeronia novacaledonica TaxID=1544861 RepID=UPI001EE3074E|nr:hypothetical protein [Caballeronia novacaledonica]